MKDIILDFGHFSLKGQLFDNPIARGFYEQLPGRSGIFNRVQPLLRLIKNIQFHLFY